MRDPDLMQRADRAAGALEQAWERWRAMHGLGSEPLPPVSSYVGYSLEEPWGQPRVVFGLRADEAELLASLLDGHDCVGPIYAEVSARPDWRRQESGSSAAPSRPYSVPLQAPAPDADQLPPPGNGVSMMPGDLGPVGQDEGRDPHAGGDYGDEDSSVGQQTAGPPAHGAEPADVGEPGWPDAEPEPPDDADAAALDPSASLAPLPDFADIRRGQDEHGPGVDTDGDEADEDAVAAAIASADVPTQGPGYRGPRYQGSPPRYDGGAGPDPAQVPDRGDTADDEANGGRRSHAAKLSRTSRRRTTRS